MLAFYQKNQRKTVSNIYLLAIVMACVGISTLFIPPRLWWLPFIIVFASFAICVFRYANIELWHSTKIVYKNYEKPRFGLLFNIFNPIWDVSACTAAFIFSRNHVDFLETAYFIIPLFMIIIISRTYSVFWNYPSSEEYFKLIVTVTGAISLSAIFNAIFQLYPFTFHDFIATIGIADAAIVGERMLFHALRMTLIHQHINATYANTTPDITTLLCGICPQGRMYVNAVMIDIGRAGRENIIGFIDRDKRYSHSYCYGLRVLGTLEDLEHIHEKHHLGKIVVCADNFQPEERQKLMEFCKNHNIHLTQYRCTEVDYN